MPRDIDERKKRQALRKLRKAAALAEQGLGPELSDWEVQFLEEVEERIETYGSAFADLEKGAKDEPLSALQKRKLREIDKKARGKGKYGDKAPEKRRSSFKSKGAPERTYGRDINEDVDEPAEPKPEPVASPPRPAKRRLELIKESKPTQKPLPAPPEPKPAPERSASPFRVIEGGKSES